MRVQFAPMLSIAAVAVTLVFAPGAVMAATKTAKECNAEYAANKPAIQASGQKKADFVAACRAGTDATPGLAPATTTAPAKAAAPASNGAAAGSVKTAKACDAEYAANKDAIKKSGETKKDFVAACRAGTEVIPGGQSTTAAPAAAPTTTTAPATTTTKPTTARSKTVPTPSVAGTPTGANQFASEGQAKARCPAGTVVWVNLKSKIFHFAGSRNYGNTKQGAYICESDATASGFRAAENEKQPQ